MKTVKHLLMTAIFALTVLLGAQPTATYAAQPDLVIIRAEAVAGQPKVVYAVQNRGTAPSGAFRIAILRGTGMVEAVSVNNLNPGDVVSFTHIAVEGCPFGQRQIIADYGNIVPESSELNNRRFVSHNC